MLDVVEGFGRRMRTPGMVRSRVVIVGGGISGLAAAYRLRELAPWAEVIVLEAGPRPGGVIQTERRDGYLIEAGADSFITAMPWGLDLCRRLGIEEGLLSTDPARRRVFVARAGRLEAIPDGLMLMAPGRLVPIVRSRVLSLRGKLRLLGELLVRPGNGLDESLASFARRRFGREMYERLLQPLIGGIYTADPERLSMRATMPQFLAMEQEHGSLIRATLRRRIAVGGGHREGAGSGARYGLFVAPRGGMADLIGALVRRLPEGTVRCHSPVERLEQAAEGQWLVHLGDRPECLTADAVIIATPARNAACLLAGVDPRLSARLDRIRSASCAIVSLGYRREQLAHPLDGFGFVVPLTERRSILSGSFASLKYPGRSPDGCVLVRVFLGGACRAEVLDRDDDELIAIAEREIAGFLGARGAPVLRHLRRWREVMPQYHVGHVELIEAIESRVADHCGLALAGNAYHGVGVPHCIRSGEQAADRIATELEIASRFPRIFHDLEPIPVGRCIDT